LKLPGSSTRTFVVFPLLVAAFELVLRRNFDLQPYWAALMGWGYLQYELVGRYRLRLGGGGPGMEKPPEQLVTGGPYAWTRNPMYLGHLIFLAGLALTFQSLFAAALLLFSLFYFQDRVRRDERRLADRFGEAYFQYKNHVKRWIPYLF